MAWKDPFDRPVWVCEGRLLATLADARAYILSLPSERQKTYRALAATEALLMAATASGPIIDAQIRMMKLIQQENELNLAREVSVANNRSRQPRQSRKPRAYHLIR